MDTSSVYIFSTWEARPTYHGYGRIKEVNGWHGDVTKCGLTLYGGRDGERGTTEYRALLRRDQADLFARPCGHCFRGEV